MAHVDTGSDDLLDELEAVRLLCQETGCAQRYLARDALAAIWQGCARIDDAAGAPAGQGERTQRFLAYLAPRSATRTSLWAWP
jgi:4-hydroxybutyryl-CoA dehydratase/vinylacetyl-CoA-Delta-isomerase